MNKSLYFIFLCSSAFSYFNEGVLFEDHENPRVIYGEFYGQLGNQLFQVAATVAYAMENDCNVSFPCLNKPDYAGIKKNRDVFFPFLSSRIYEGEPFYYKEEKSYKYKAIPLTKRIRIEGYFQSEKYFKPYKDLIIKLFSPSKSMRERLYNSYKDILKENTVGIHVRAFVLEHPEHMQNHHIFKLDWFEKVAKLFPEDSVFLIFSDQINYAKKLLKDFSRRHIFIEGNDYHEDFYLLSFCKHQILTQSTFGWWAAYLNSNPDKKVVTPEPWFKNEAVFTSQDVIPNEWIKIKYDK